MKKNILVVMLMGLTLFTSTAAISKAKLSNYPKVKKAIARTKHDVPKKNGPVAKYSMAALMKNVEYDFAKTSVRPAYNTQLDQLAAVVIQNKSALTLRGYADSIGSYKGNWVVSDKRAKSVKGYLISKGVDSTKIVATPFGSTKPIASNKTKAGRQKNRRVEIKINEINN